MRIERWWWLAIFCVVSFGIHLGVVSRSRSFGSITVPPKPVEIEVALEAPPEPKPAPKPKPLPKLVPVAKAKPDKPVQLAKALQPRPKIDPTPRKEPVQEKKPDGDLKAPPRRVKTDEERPTQAKAEPGGIDPLKDEKPLPLGLPTRRDNAPPTRIRVAKADITPRQPDNPLAEPTERAPETPDLRAPAPSPNREAPSTRPGLRGSLTVENPLGSLGPADEKPSFSPSPAAKPGSPRLNRTAKNPINFSGGGSPSPAPVPGGSGGLRAPEAPPEDIVFNGGGAGGQKLPKIAPRIGGGGGRSILSVDNPLAKTAIPEERPGVGPGAGGGAGVGAGGGAGSGSGKGIGTRLDGRVALGSLRTKPGSGIGAGSGTGIGTRPPGGGRGTGAELPGTGGDGVGYGRGKGVGIGSGVRPGVGDGNGGGGRGGSPGSGNGGGGSGSGGRGGRLALDRGIPFGDIAGLLRGGDADGGGGSGGGPGGPGRGGVFGKRPRSGGGSESVHIVYVLDTSSSMREYDKIGKAKMALRKALNELKPQDTFNIVTFNSQAATFSAIQISGSRDNLVRASNWVRDLVISPGTNMSAGLQMAFSDSRLTHVFLLSDGEPSSGIRNPDDMRAAVREWNRARAKVVTLALGRGEQFPGIPLLRSLAEDHNGQFSYVDVTRADAE